MPGWFWYLIAALIAALTLFVLYRHFFRKKGTCCEGECNGKCEGCRRECLKNKDESTDDQIG